jgi:hypothetical protein
MDLREALARVTGLWQPRDPGLSQPARWHWTVLPFFFANPLMGVAGGAATIGAFQLGERQTTGLSKFEATAFLSEKNQSGVVLRSEVRLPRDAWILVGDWSEGRFPNPAWGLGGDTAEASRTIVSRRQLQLHETAYRRVLGRLFVGAGWWLDDFYDMVDQSAAGAPSAFSSYGIGTGRRSVSSGMTLNLLLDDRDSAIEPTRGVYALARWRFEPRWLGTADDWTSIYADLRGYLRVPGRRDVFAFWAYAWSSFGNTPYLLLPAVGDDPDHRSARGYTEGRYTAKDLIYTEAEWRTHLWEFAGAALGVNAAAPSDRGTGTRGPLFRTVHPALTGGLRLLLDAQSRAKLDVDGAWAPGRGVSLYIAANETF